MLLIGAKAIYIYGNPENGNHQSITTQIDSGGILTKTNNMGERSGKEIAKAAA